MHACLKARNPNAGSHGACRQSIRKTCACQKAITTWTTSSGCGVAAAKVMTYLRGPRHASDHVHHCRPLQGPAQPSSQAAAGPCLRMPAQRWPLRRLALPAAPPAPLPRLPSASVRSLSGSGSQPRAPHRMRMPFLQAGWHLQKPLPGLGQLHHWLPILRCHCACVGGQLAQAPEPPGPVQQA